MSNFVALIVEDDPFQRESLAELLKSEGLKVVECADAATAELMLASTGPDLRALVISRDTEYGRREATSADAEKSTVVEPIHPKTIGDPDARACRLVERAGALPHVLSQLGTVKVRKPCSMDR